MCAIVGSFNRQKLLELIELNSYRGSHSYSFSTLDQYGKLRIVTQALGTIKESEIVIPSGSYGIVHIQAPTTDAKTLSSIHPAIDVWWQETVPSRCLWHNGIIKANHIARMQKEQQSTEQWDTKLLLNDLRNGFEVLNNVDGSFSCLYYSSFWLYLFRNEISPMFIDDHMNISSTKFVGSKPTEPNTVFYMDTVSKALRPVYKFETVENPYYFGSN